MSKHSQNKSLVIVTGLSGSGMSSVLHALQDFGYEVFDNFPLSLVKALVDDPQSGGKPMAIGIDSRARGFSASGIEEIVAHYGAELIFMTCEDGVLQKRFTETRRRHPLAKDKPVRFGIAREHELLGTLQDSASLTIDTTALNIHDLRHLLKGYFDIETDSLLTITLMSFAFKHGIPREADIVMDVRFLQNPHWIDKLRSKTGKDAEVQNYVSEDLAFEPFTTHFKNLLEALLPRYAKEGKSYLTIGIGCTGGRHRSVFTVEHLGAWLKNSGVHTYIEHRDLKT